MLAASSLSNGLTGSNTPNSLDDQLCQTPLLAYLQEPLIRRLGMVESPKGEHIPLFFFFSLSLSLSRNAADAKHGRLSLLLVDEDSNDQRIVDDVPKQKEPPNLDS